MFGRFRNVTLAVMGLALLATALYLPFLSSGLIFDDYGLYRGGGIYDYAQVVFSLRPRTFPYFTLGFITILNDAIELNRIVSLVLHICCSWMLFALLTALLEDIERPVTGGVRHARLLAFVGASWFTLHPISVYGAAYLVQRTVLFATLFSMLSLWFYRRAFVQNRTVDIFTAALFFSLAVFSKEHAIMLPLAVVPLAMLYEGNSRTHLKRITLYLVLCVPAALTVLLATKYIVATNYEPTVGMIVPPIQNAAVLGYSSSNWLVSVVLQAGFFFDYLKFWLVPDVRLLSADMRFDLLHIWSSWWALPKALLFFSSPLVAVYFLRKKGLIALFCCGFLYCWFLFMPELAAVRFQEPFVLYRTYMWAPGYALMLIAMCVSLPRRWVIWGAIPVLVVFLFLARDRLQSLSSEENVWKDAAAKLESPTLPGSDRIFYNRGLAYLRNKQYEDAIADFSRTIALNPKIARAYSNRALAYYSWGKYAEAMPDLDYAVLLESKDSSVQFVRGLIFEHRGCILAAKQAFSASMAMGNHVAKLKLEALEKKKTMSGQRGSDASTCPN